MRKGPSTLLPLAVFAGAARVVARSPWLRRSPTMLARLVLFGILFFSGCEGGSTVAPPNGDDDDDDGGTVTRGTLAVTVEATAQDREIARLLGSSTGALRGAEVVIQRGGESTTSSAVTDSLGVAHFSNLLPGNYSVTATRLLSAEDIARLAAADPSLADVNAFGGGGFAEVSPPTSSTRVQVIAGRRGSLVFSEVYHFTPDVGAAFLYNTAKYIEFYNNSDTTVYLGGKLFVRGILWAWDDPSQPCSSLERWRVDPRGIWSQHYVRLPGSARSHPIPPGGAAVLAMDGIDHRPADDRLPDLSNAHFEYVGQGDVDNPHVQNVQDVGPTVWNNSSNRGMIFAHGGKEVLALAEGDPAAFERGFVDQFGGTHEHHLIPAENILDVFAMITPLPHAAGPLCTPLVHEGLDAQHGTLFESSSPLTISRRVLLTLPDGRAVLQRTKTSARDFERKPATPGTVP